MYSYWEYVQNLILLIVVYDQSSLEASGKARNIPTYSAFPFRVSGVTSGEVWQEEKTQIPAQSDLSCLNTLGPVTSCANGENSLFLGRIFMTIGHLCL